MFSIRIVTANHYQAQPIRDLDVAYSDFRGSEVKQVPVIRIFGATPVGQKTCLHVHGVFPYIYVGCGPEEFATDKDLRQFATSLDLALQVAMGKASGNTHHVFKVITVQAVPMYGYHSRSRRFLKIYFYNPLMVKRAVELLQSGAVMNKVFQPHEAHIPFILQFFMDYNLYGMNLIHLAAIKFRRDKNENNARAGTSSSSPDSTPINLSSVMNTTAISSQKWTMENIPSSLLLGSEVQRQSVCELEVDAVAMDILNRHELQGNTEMNPGLLAIYNEERERREIKGQLDDLNPPASPDRGVIEDTESELNGKARLADIIQKQTDELKAITGVSKLDDDDNESILQDTLAEPSASQLILHDSQYNGDEDSEATPEEQSQPVVNEELVQSVLDSLPQRSSQSSQHAEDQDLAQLLVDLAQDNASPEEGSILSSQNTQEDRNLESDKEDDDAQESLEMSQAWGEVSDKEETEQSRTVHDISASEEDTQDESFIIAQFDGGSDEKPAPTKKKTLGMKRPAEGFVQGSCSNPGNVSALNSFPPETKTYGNKKISLAKSEKTKNCANLADRKTPKVVFKKKVNEDVKRVTVKKGTLFPLTKGLEKNDDNPTKVGQADLLDNQRSGQDVILPKSAAIEALPLRKASPGSDDSVTKRNLEKNALEVQSSEARSQKKTLSEKNTPTFLSNFSKEKSAKEHSTEISAAGRSSSKQSSLEDALAKTSLKLDTTSATLPVLSNPANSSVLEQVPSTSNTIRFTGCDELQGLTGLGNIKKNPSWNPVVMLINCPIETDSKGKITFSGTSLPRKQLEQIRKDNLKAQPVRRSSFSRKITPPRKFMDEQYWMDQMRKVSKQKNEPIVNVDSTHKKCDDTHADGMPCEQTEMLVSKETKEQINVLDVANEPPCLLSPGRLKVASDSQYMPILEKITDTSDLHASQHNEQQCVITNTKAILQDKYLKKLLLPDKKSKMVKKASSYKHCTEKDDKRYKMLSKTFTKLSLSAKRSAQETSIAAEISVPNLTRAECDTPSPVARLSSDNSEITNLQNTVHSSSAEGVFSSQGNDDGSSQSRQQECPQQTKRKSSVSRKRKGSDGSDEWAGKKSPSFKCRSSQNEKDELMFGRTYPFRKRERISYDDSDFPDVVFDIMCWSDEEDVKDRASDRADKQYKEYSSELQQTMPASFSGKIGNIDSVQSLGESKETADDPTSRGPRKRGRPPGSKNKTSKFAKIGSMSLKGGTGSINHPPRTKPHLTFTVDSMLPNGKKSSETSAGATNTNRLNSIINQSNGNNVSKNQSKRLPAGTGESLETVVTSCNSLVGLPISKHARISQPIANQLSIVTTMGKQHKIHSKLQPIQTILNGHHSDVEDGNCESALYRDTMWNLGYFSPRIREKEGSPPRCWSPSIETENLVAKSKQSSLFQENEDQFTVNQPRCFLRSCADEHSHSKSKRESQHGKLKGNQLNRMHRESNKLSSTDISSQDGMKTDKAADVSDSPEDDIHIKEANRQTSTAGAAALEVGISVTSSEDGANYYHDSSASELDKIDKRDTNTLPNFSMSEKEFEGSLLKKHEEEVALGATCHAVIQKKSDNSCPNKPPKGVKSIPCVQHSTLERQSCFSTEGVTEAATSMHRTKCTTNTATTSFDKFAPKTSRHTQFLGQSINSGEKTDSSPPAYLTNSPTDHLEDLRLQDQDKKPSDTKSTSSPLQSYNETPVSQGSSETPVHSETMYSSSDDFTPAQRKLKTPSEKEEEEEEEEDDTCNTSQSSSGSEASLSLDMSLITSRIPSISPPREATDFTTLQKHCQSQSKPQEITRHASGPLFESRHTPNMSGKDSDVHRLTCKQLEETSHGEVVARLCEKPNTYQVKDEQISESRELLTGRTTTSGNANSRVDKVEAKSNLQSQNDSNKFSDSYSQLKNEQLNESLELLSPSPTGITGHSEDSKSLISGGEGAAESNLQSDKDDLRSDLYSQLVCPDTPSQGHQSDTAVSRTDHLTFSAECEVNPSCISILAEGEKPNLLHRNSEDERSVSKTVDKRSKVIYPETDVEEPLDFPSASTKENLHVAEDEDRFTNRKEVESEEEEPMEIDMSQDTSQSKKVPSKESSHLKKLTHEQTYSQGDSPPPLGQTIGLRLSPRGSCNDDLLESRQKMLSVLSSSEDKTHTVSNTEELVMKVPSEKSHTPPGNGNPPQKKSGDLDSQISETAKPVMVAHDSDPKELPKILTKTGRPVQNESDTGAQSHTYSSSVSHSQSGPVNSLQQDLPTSADLVHFNSKTEAQGKELIGNVWTPAQHPPSLEAVQASLQEFGLPHVHHKRVFFGNPEDVQQPSKLGVRDDGRAQTNLPSHLPEAKSKLAENGLGQWQAHLMTLNPHPLLSPSNVVPESGVKAALIGDTDAVITPAKLPPSVAEVQDWLKTKNAKNVPDQKHGNKDINSSEDDKQEEGVTNKDILADIHVPPTSKVQFSDMSQVVSVENRWSSTAGKTSQTLTPVQSPKTNVYKFQMINTPSSTPLSTPKGGSVGSQIESDSPKIHPFSWKGSSQPQHSTPCRIKTQAVQRGLPATPVSGWKHPANPSPAGTSTSQDKASTSSSMRQSLLFTPVQTSGHGKGIGDMSQIEGATPNNTCGFKMPQLNLQDAKAMHEVQHLTVMCLELHVKTRRDYHPDPDFDPIRGLFYSIQQDSQPLTDKECDKDEDLHGVIIIEESKHGNAGPSTSVPRSDSLAHSGISNLKTTSVSSENELLEELLAVVRKYDPDILVGYEVQQHSWGYLLERAAFLDIDLCSQISRLPEFKKESSFSSERDAYGADHQSEINIAGRITLNLWRLMRHEVALTNYTFENVAFHVLHQRVPQFTYRKLTDWFDHRYHHLSRWRVIEYYSVRVRGSLKLLHQLDLIGRTSELARVFGIDFYSVLSRGTQFRVESMMLRTAKPKNYAAMSPSVQQRSRMKAPECIPLVMEPESRFYQDPVIVLDFQSLYPTMMIAYNYCYSTCLGRLEHIANGGQYVLGCGSLSVSTSQLKKLLRSDSLHVSPNGIVFVKPSVRRGVLPVMLEQILKLRLIVKKSLKDFKNDKTLHRMLDSRQLALKLIANVTYGYTSANFSGRMPCIEVGDSVVRKGRETLERAIHMVNSTKKWGAQVVYGDTDSMFVLVKGATRERAFEIGKEIRDAVTAANPKPVKLKLEKVYHPCVLQSKKRYVGYSYESPDQTEPDFDAKGIETVRRDSCPAVGKILERALKVLFTTRDVSQVKQYVQKQFQKILDGQTTMQDLIFAKEYRGRHTYQAGACVPALEITRRLLAVDRRAEPRVGQRVPYVIVHGSPGMPLIHLVRTPNQVLQDPSLRLNTTYYLTRQLVPSLNRVFGLLGVDTMAWYQELPRWHRITACHLPGTPGKKGTISQYFASLNCMICEKVTKDGLCSECKGKAQVTSAALLSRVQQWQLVQQDMAKICGSCCNFSDKETDSCVSLDCPIMFKINKISRQLSQVPHYQQLLDGL